MKTLCIIINFLLFASVFSQNFYYDPVELKNFRDTFQHTFFSGQYIFHFDDQTTCYCTFYKGKLHGRWQCKYENGLIKSKGFFVDGRPYGKWNFWSSDGHQKAVVVFNNHFNYTLKSVRRGLFNYQVLFGRGKNKFQLSHYMYIVPYKRGLKHGLQLKKDKEGEIIEKLHFSKGVYHGSVMSLIDTKYKLLGNYFNGLPVDKWEIYDKENLLIREINFSQNPYLSIGDRPYLAPFEALWEQYLFRIVTDNYSENLSLFKVDSNSQSLFCNLNEAFISGKTMFYHDQNLNKPYIYSLSQQSILKVPFSEIDTILPHIFAYVEYVYFSKQTFSLQNMILHSSILTSYYKNDSIFIVSTPIFYFPQSYRELSFNSQHGIIIRSEFDKILNGEYFSIPLAILSREDLSKSEKLNILNFQKLMVLQTELMNNMQNLIIAYLGLKNFYFTQIQE